MSETNLTKDADRLLCTLYKEYRAKCKNGKSKDSARRFGSIRQLKDNIMPKWSVDNINNICRELSRARLFICQFDSYGVYTSYLSADAIAQKKIQQSFQLVIQIKESNSFLVQR